MDTVAIYSSRWHFYTVSLKISGLLYYELTLVVCLEVHAAAVSFSHFRRCAANEYFYNAPQQNSSHCNRASFDCEPFIGQVMLCHAQLVKHFDLPERS